MIVAKHKNQGRIILAICDKDILGKKFEENDLRLDLCSDFYKGEELNPDETLKICKKAYIINIVGEKSIDFALKNDLIEKKHIIKIKNIPHAQVIQVIG